MIDTAKLEVIETRLSGAMPYGAAVTPDGARVLVTNQQAGTVSVLASDGTSSPPIKVGDYPEGVIIGADGMRAYVANWFSDDVAVLDLDTLKVIRRIKCPGGPRAIVSVAEAP
ncbi:MAG TPA: YncE family protein [Alphaproteobacteria bacterium]|nr:YncE family protein [Alphaproteobacteria bacterium]